MATNPPVAPSTPEPADAASVPGGPAIWAAWLVLACVVFAAALRLGVASSMPYLADRPPEGLLKSDPGLIHYVTARIVDAGGWPPDDFRHDPRIEHPEATDVPAMFTVGQEFVIAWLYLPFGEGVPLHLFAAFVMSVVAALAVVGVYGLAFEVTRSAALAGLAGVFYVLSAASYRTIGFLYIREDLSLPLFAVHLWLLVRAMRSPSRSAFALAGLAAAAALATWHAMTFVFAIEGVCLLAWWIRTGRSPMAGRAGWLFAVVLGALALVIPVLRAKLFVLSPAFLAFAALTLGPAFEARLPTSALVRASARLALFAGLVAITRPLTAALGGDDYAHVFDLMAAKVRHLGQRPADPTLLSFDVRMLWQGPFATGSPSRVLLGLGALALAVPVEATRQLVCWWRGRGDTATAVLAAMAAVLLVLALLVDRLLAVAVVVAPVVAVALVAEGVSRTRRAGPSTKAPPSSSWSRASSWSWWLVAGLAASTVAQALLFGVEIRGIGLRQWYDLRHQVALVDMLDFIDVSLPEDAAVAADFVNSTAVLASTGRRVVLQPKYETNRSRRRIERFETAFYHESPEAFAQIVREEFRASHLLVDIGAMWFARYEAGLPASQRVPFPGTAARSLMDVDEAALVDIPGYRLLHTSGGSPPRMRLFELLPADQGASRALDISEASGTSPR